MSQRLLGEQQAAPPGQVGAGRARLGLVWLSLFREVTGGAAGGPLGHLPAALGASAAEVVAQARPSWAGGWRKTGREEKKGGKERRRQPLLHGPPADGFCALASETASFCGRWAGRVRNGGSSWTLNIVCSPRKREVPG